MFSFVLCFCKYSLLSYIYFCLCLWQLCNLLLISARVLRSWLGFFSLVTYTLHTKFCGNTPTNIWIAMLTAYTHTYILILFSSITFSCFFCEFHTFWALKRTYRYTYVCIIVRYLLLVTASDSSSSCCVYIYFCHF